MVTAPEELPRTASFGRRSCPVAADVVETSQVSVLSAYKKKRLAKEIKRKKIARLLHLMTMSDDLPCSRENSFLFAAERLRIVIEGCWQGPGFRNIRINGMNVHAFS